MSIGEIDIDAFDDAAIAIGFSTEQWNQENLSAAFIESALTNRVELAVENVLKTCSSQSSRFFSLMDSKTTIPSRTSWNAKERSLVFEIEGRDLLRGKIGGINGIGNLLSDAFEHADCLSKAADNCKIEWVYNCSHSLPVDITKAVLTNHKGIDASRKLLRENWMRFHEEHLNDPDAKYMQFCHSQGAVAVKWELAALPKEVRERIIVVALAPAAIIPKSLCFESYNYSSKRDPVPYGGFAAELVFSPIKGCQDLKDFKDLILLDPHPDAPFFDHAFDRPTFKQVITDHLENYIKNYGLSQ